MPKSVFVLLGIGLIFFVGSLPFFFMRKPIAVSHQAYKYAHSTNEVITPDDGRFYGIAFLGIGTFFTVSFIHVWRGLHRDIDKKKKASASH